MGIYAVTTRGYFVVTAAALLLAVVGCTREQNPDIPLPADFQHQLLSDLQKHFASEQPPVTAIEYDLLRTVPTITGLAYPKYYLWVHLRRADSTTTEAAVRVAAINRAFMVTDVIYAEGIRSGKEEIGIVFPKVLLPEIQRRAVARSE